MTQRIRDSDLVILVQLNLDGFIDVYRGILNAFEYKESDIIEESDGYLHVKGAYANIFGSIDRDAIHLVGSVNSDCDLECTTYESSKYPQVIDGEDEAHIWHDNKSEKAYEFIHYAIGELLINDVCFNGSSNEIRIDYWQSLKDPATKKEIMHKFKYNLEGEGCKFKSVLN